jgi:tetratricopeptide (TPR) repeat protein
MTEVQRSVDEDKIYEFVKGDVANQNRFYRAFRGLKAINLIIERTDLFTNIKKFDLHPMVRNFIKTEYHNTSERKRYISMVLRHYDDVLLISRKDTKILSVAILEELVTKIELELEKKDLKSAIDTIDYTSDDFVQRGLHEEYVRLAKKVFFSINWETSDWQEDDKLLNLIHFLIKTMTEVGKVDEAKNFLATYTKNAPSGTSRYISICELNSYVNWFIQDYENAIEWGRRGEELKKRSGVDTSFDTSHTLALSLRDNGQADEALQIFSHGLSIDEIVSEDHKYSNRGAAFYGNVGRCISLKSDHDKALILYLKSYELLESDSGSVVLINKGYASYWIAEALYGLGEYFESSFFARRALKIWEKRAPLLSRFPDELLTKIENKLPSTHFNQSDHEVEIHCKNFVATYLVS